MVTQYNRQLDNLHMVELDASYWSPLWLLLLLRCGCGGAGRHGGKSKRAAILYK
jgi:hypothetical protein